MLDARIPYPTELKISRIPHSFKNLCSISELKPRNVIFCVFPFASHQGWMFYSLQKFLL
jgi:hypothetical protein